MEISGLACDSRKVQPGFLFAALDNGKTNGVDYIRAAIDNGASVILTPDTRLEQEFPHVRFIKSNKPAYDFAKLAAKFYPLQPEHIAAVTGTNGKTSIADFVRQLLVMSGHQAASIGTLGLIINKHEPIPGANTTPNQVDLHQQLQQLAKDGIDYAVLEASSHGICQYRVGGVRLQVAGFTNLTQDHLDFHKTMENYFEAKKLLFTDILQPGGTAVLNADIKVFEALKKACHDTGKQVISYGKYGSDIKLLEETPLAHGQKLRLRYYGREMEITIPLAGDFQAMNILCALGIAAEMTGTPFEMIRHIEKIHGAKGRLELVTTTPKGAAVYVDYAHTPDALENVIRALRPHTTGRLHVVFGCGGDRDATKRPIMGKIVNDQADICYVTDDNPRTEDPAAIRAQILAACPKAQDIGDRAEAIRTAVAALQPGDVLIVAGKGHETGQYVNDKIVHFSDQEEILKALK